ncbi:MAG TPA: hypothetical protein EYP88_08690 [Anaerolineales bacterium]|nr:hypothetical protein [Anaerolineales bacterium]
MAGKKKPYDGIVTAVRYSPRGDIDWVRAFERHGFVFSDRVILSRADLLERLKAGKKFKTGRRIPQMGNEFEIFNDIRLIGSSERAVITSGASLPARDDLSDLPLT